MDYDINDTTLGLEREHEALTWLRENDPVHWDAKNEAWLLTRNADIRAALNRPRGVKINRGVDGAGLPSDDPTKIIFEGAASYLGGSEVCQPPCTYLVPDEL